MEIHKIVNLDAEELALQMRQSAEQIFRLRFQLSMGQNEGVKKLRELKKDIARIKTVERQRKLGIAAPAASGENGSTRTARKTKKSRSKTKSTGGHANKPSAKTSRKPSRVPGKSMAAGRTSMKSAKRGKANAKKGGS